MEYSFFLVYLGIVAAVIYGFAYLFKHHTQLKDYKGALLAFSFMAMFGPVGEILVGNTYHLLTGTYLWQYQIYPIHGGYTSLIAPAMWGVSGLYIHLFWGRIGQIGYRLVRYTVASADIIAGEVMFNGLYFLLTGGKYVFYYQPPDLLHFSSLLTIPFYIVAAFAIMRALKYSAAHKRFYSVLFLFVSVVVVYLI